MSSKRRVLGLSSSKPPPPSPSPVTTTNTSNGNNQRTTSPEGNDLLIANKNGRNSTETTLSCPICLENMVTLSQLNQHLDDEHSSFGESNNENYSSSSSLVDLSSTSVTNKKNGFGSENSQIENDFKLWFKKKVVDKANGLVSQTQQRQQGQQGQQGQQRILKLDLFDSSFTMSETGSQSMKIPIESRNSSPTLESDRQQDKDKQIVLKIPRKHWKKPTGNDTCHHKDVQKLNKPCRKPLNVKNGVVNCRKCGQLFCNQHTMYRIKLNVELQYDSEGGDKSVWSRCCEDCYVSKPNWLANDGLTVDLTNSFKVNRSNKLNSKRLLMLSLERRLLKMIEFLQDVNDGKRQLRDFDKFQKQLVDWVDDKQVTKCGICLVKFGFWNRKHHCRVCGDVVCGDLNRGCSMDVPVNMIIDLINVKEGGETSLQKQFKHLNDDGDNVTIRICLQCKQKLFNKKVLQKDLNDSKNDDLTQFYNQFKLIKFKIDKEITNGRFNDDDNAKINLIELFGKLEKLGKLVTSKLKQIELKIEQELNNNNGDGDTSSEYIKLDHYRLLKSLNQAILTYLQENLPTLRKSQQDKLNKEREELEQDNRKLNGNSSNKPPAEESTNSMPATSTTTGKTVANGDKKLLKKDIRVYREKLMVLNEQKFLIEKLYQDFKKQRKFDDLKSLEVNLNDLNYEIDAIQEKLGDESF